MLPADIDLCCVALKHAYHRLCTERGHYDRYKLAKVNSIRRVAEKLGHKELAFLFVRSQFEGMSRDWCLVTFKRPYPPARVVFSNSTSCWKRYTKFARQEGARRG